MSMLQDDEKSFSDLFFQKGFSFNLIFLLLHSLLSFTPSDPHFQFIQWIFSQLILSLHEIYGIKFVLLIFKCFSVGYKHECCIVYKNIFYILLITLTRTLWLACLIYLKVQIRQFKRESRESKKKLRNKKGFSMGYKLHVHYVKLKPKEKGLWAVLLIKLLPFLLLFSGIFRSWN